MWRCWRAPRCLTTTLVNFDSQLPASILVLMVSTVSTMLTTVCVLCAIFTVLTGSYSTIVRSPTTYFTRRWSFGRSRRSRRQLCDSVPRRVRHTRQPWRRVRRAAAPIEGLDGTRWRGGRGAPSPHRARSRRRSLASPREHVFVHGGTQRCSRSTSTSGAAARGEYSSAGSSAAGSAARGRHVASAERGATFAAIRARPSFVASARGP